MINVKLKIGIILQPVKSFYRFFFPYPDVKVDMRKEPQPTSEEKTVTQISATALEMIREQPIAPVVEDWVTPTRLYNIGERVVFTDGQLRTCMGNLVASEPSPDNSHWSEVQNDEIIDDIMQAMAGIQGDIGPTGTNGLSIWDESPVIGDVVGIQGDQGVDVVTAGRINMLVENGDSFEVDMEELRFLSGVMQDAVDDHGRLTTSAIDRLLEYRGQVEVATDLASEQDFSSMITHNVDGTDGTLANPPDFDHVDAVQAFDVNLDFDETKKASSKIKKHKYRRLE